MASIHAGGEPAPAGLSTRTYEEVLRNIHDAVYTLDPNGVITWVNEVAIEEFDGGYTRDELIGAPVTKILDMADVERCADLIADLVANDPEGSRRCEIELVAADGRTIPGDLHLALLPAEGGSFAGTLGVVRDITEQKRREQGLSVLNRVLRHNLRNELSVVLAGIDRLGADDEAVAESIQAAVDRLLRASEKARTIEAVLARSAGERESNDLGAVATDRAEVIAERFPDASIDVSVAGDYWVEDDGLLSALVDELLDNAARHHHGDDPTVRVEVETGGSGWVVLSVTDDGPGIPPGELEALAAGLEAPLDHTSGLGLWLVTWVANRLNGRLTFEEADPNGTRVEVRLPTVEHDPDDA